MIVFATGFDAMTGPLKAMNVIGSGGAKITEAWEAGPRTYLGLQVADFPNLFTVTGPGSPSVLSSMVVSIEQHVDFIADMLLHMKGEGHTNVRATLQAQDDWVEHVNDISKTTSSSPTPPATAGIWARTSRASRGSSCRTSVA